MIHPPSNDMTFSQIISIFGWFLCIMSMLRSFFGAPAWFPGERIRLVAITGIALLIIGRLLDDDGGGALRLLGFAAAGFVFTLLVRKAPEQK